MDFQRFFEAFDSQTRTVSLLTQRVEELRLSNLQLLQAVRKAERLPHILDPETRRLASRFREQALACERETLRQQRARKMAQIEREMAVAAAKNDAVRQRQQRQQPQQPQQRQQRGPTAPTGTDARRGRPAAQPVAPPDYSALARRRNREPPPVVKSEAPPHPPAVVSTSQSTEDELSNTVIAKDRLDLFRQVGSGGAPPDLAPPPPPPPGPGGMVGSSLLDQVNLESPSGAITGHDDATDPDPEDVSACGANTTTGTGFYTNSTDLQQYMRHSTNTITSMFTLQEEEEEEASSRRQPPVGHPGPEGRRADQATTGERQHLTRYLMEASLPDEEEEVPRRTGSGMAPAAARPWDALMEEQFEAQAELGLQLQAEIRAQEDRLRAQMQLFNQMRSNSAGVPSVASPSARHTPFAPVLRSDEDSLRMVHPLPKEEEAVEEEEEEEEEVIPLRPESMPATLHAKFCRLSALVKGHLTRQLYLSDKAQAILRTIKDTAECALYLSESTDASGSLVARRQDAYLHSRLVSQLQASLFEFHDLFFATSPAQRMAVIAATRETHLRRQQEEMERSEADVDQLLPEREVTPAPTVPPPPRLSAATMRRMEMREKGQLNSVVSPRFINRPHTASPPADVASRPSTAPAAGGPPRARVLRQLHLQQQQQQQQPVPQPSAPTSGRSGARVRLGSQPVQRSRSLNAGSGGKAANVARPSTAPMKRGHAHRVSLPQTRRDPRPIHVVAVKDEGRRMVRKVRAERQPPPPLQ